MDDTTHYLFLLHGMGQQKNGWSDPYAEQIKELAQKYANTDLNNLSMKVEIVELEYGSILAQNMEQMIASGKTLELVLGGAYKWLMDGIQDPQNVAQPLDNHVSIPGFIRDFAIDVAAYIWQRDTTIFVLNNILKTMLEKIALHPISNRYSILCHSLGTKVGWDLLHMLYQQKTDLYGGDNALGNLFKLSDQGDAMGTSVTFQSLYLVANVMPLLNGADLQTFSENNSPVRLRRTAIPYQGGIITRSYAVVNNQYDPFARWGRTTLMPSNYYNLPVNISQAHAWNMHDLGYYLAHPSVHIPLLKDIYGIDISKEDMAKSVSEYESTNHNPVIESALAAALSPWPSIEGNYPPELIKNLWEIAKFLEKDNSKNWTRHEV